MQRRRVRDFAELKSMLPCPCGSGLLGAKCCLATAFLDSLMYRKYHFCECSYVVRPCLGPLLQVCLWLKGTGLAAACTLVDKKVHLCSCCWDVWAP